MHAASPQTLLIALIFIIAGCVKGVTGMGLPTVSMGLLGLLIAPAEAASLLIIPSVVTNVWQYLAGRYRRALLRRLWPMLLAVLVATWAAAGLIAGTEAGHAAAALGVALAIYATLGLCQARLAVRSGQETWLAPLTGAATGIVTGATGVFVIPAVPYLQALGLEKDELVQALGLSFTVSTIALAVGLASYGALHLRAAGASTLCTVPALGGMLLGQAVRAKIDPLTFRRLFFAGLLLLGADLVAGPYL